jgi:hypothetical protein
MQKGWPVRNGGPPQGASFARRQASVVPALPQAQHRAVTPAADLPSCCHFVSEKTMLVDTTPSGFHGFWPAAAYVQHSRRAVT